MKIFSSISKRYDIINKINSLGFDDKWRRFLVKNFVKGVILDVGTGSGATLKHIKDYKIKIGIDISKEMLKIARLKTNAYLILADAHFLPFKDEMFDTIILVFVYRNLEDRKTFLKEAYRLLKNKGKLLILEFFMPKNVVLKLIYILVWLPLINLIGYIISGNFFAYKYLRNSIKKFSSKDIILELSSFGFKVRTLDLSFGIVRLYIAFKI